MQEHRSQARTVSRHRRNNLGHALIALLIATAVPAGAAFAQQQPGPPPRVDPAPATPPAATAPPQAEPDEAAPPRSARERRRQARRDRMAQRPERQRERNHARDWRRTMGLFALAPLCGPTYGRRLDNDIRRIERVVSPTEAQRSQLDDLKTAAARARAEAQEGCDDPAAETPPGRMKAIEERLANVQKSVQTLRGPLDTFYNSLDEDQKTRFNDLNLTLTAGGGDVPRERQRRRWRQRYHHPFWPFWPPGWR